MGNAGRFDDGLEAKLRARMFASYVTYLRNQGHFDIVRARLQAETIELCEDGPASGWVNATYFADLCDAVGALFGAAEVRQMTKWATKTTTFVILRPIIQGIVNVFGATPLTFLTHLDIGTQSVSKGFRTKFSATSDHGGELVLHSAYVTETAMTSETWSAVFEEVIALSGSLSTVECLGRTMRGPHSESHFQVAWEARR